MLSQRIQRWSSSAAVVFALAQSALAGVWLVDDDGGPGVNFTDIQSAVLAAAPGDVLLVAPGNYVSTCVDIDKPLRILGTGADPYEVFVSCYTTPVRIHDVAGNDPVVLANLSGQDTMVVQDCDAPVLLLDIALPVTARTSPDVRVHRIRTPIKVPASVEADFGTRLEAVDCVFQGKQAKAIKTCAGLSGSKGGPGVSVTSSRVHLSHCSSTGGQGGSVSCIVFGDEYAGDGGAGINLNVASMVFCGLPGDVVAGGLGGDFVGSLACGYEGVRGPGLAVLFSSTAQYSDVRFTGGSGGAPCGNTWVGPAIHEVGTVTLQQVTPAQPVLELLGTPGPGTTVTLRTHAPPGAAVTLFLGRHALVQPEPGIEVEQLCERQRVRSLGIAVEGEPLDHVLFLPAWMTPGTCLFAQVQVQLPTGERFNTNSIPLLAR